MVCSCCAFGCTNRFIKGSGISFHKFPTNELKRALWIRAVRRRNWKPSSYTVICGEHFQTGRPSKDRDHPDYVPNVFSYTKWKKRKIRTLNKYKKIELEKESPEIERERPKIVVLEQFKTEEPAVLPAVVSTPQESFVAKENSEDASNSEILMTVDESTPAEEENSTVEEPRVIRIKSEHVKRSKNLVRDVEPKTTMPLFAYRYAISKLKYENTQLQEELRQYKIDNGADILSKLKAENERLQNEVMQSKIDNVVDIVSKLKAENAQLQNELRQSKIDNMVDIALDMNTLREEIRTLKEKLSLAEFPTLLLNNRKKLQYYTGMQDLESFNNIVQSSKDLIDATFNISKETQLLIVLMKLKMKYQDEDMGVRFNVSRRTIRRILNTWLPILSLEESED